MDIDSKIDEFVNVSLRIRPVLNQDSTDSSCLQVISKQPPVLIVLDRTQTYHFDNIFTEEADQDTVYNETVKPLVEYVKRGYSCTVFAYGQTGTGKTYTMGTNNQVPEHNEGLIPRALKEFFTYYDDYVETEISVSFIEIYNEKVFDLLQNNNKPPLTVKGFHVQGFNQERVYNCCDAKRFLDMGNRNRHTSGTKQNSNSSRSHAVFTIHCNVKHKNHETTAKLNLVDLAGSESVRKTGNRGSSFQEGVNINKGLLCIGQVMTALSTNSSFIPYRQSMITTILQDSLNKRNLVSLIACIKTNPEDCNETIQTLEFAQRVKKMKNKPEVNEVIMQFKRDNPALFQPVRANNTPFKRPAPLFQTPSVAKRARTIPMKSVNEQPESTLGDSPKSLSSISSVSSISSNINLTQQTLSPVIKKYITAMECSLVDRIETLIKHTLKRPTRSSMLQIEREKENIQKTPGMSWNRIQNEVTKLVRSEIAQLTSKRAASSPIDEQINFDNIRRVLNYESPVFNECTGEVSVRNDTKCSTIADDETVFKVPELPVSKKQSGEPSQSKRTPSISPIEFVPRRSTRLSLKKVKGNAHDNSCTCICEVKNNTVATLNESRQKRRRSVRLVETHHQSLVNNQKSLEDFDLDATKEIVKKRALKRKVVSKFDECASKRTIKDTPMGKRLMEKNFNVDSPATAHTKQVLTLLNNGNQKQLEKLHSIGPKTAQQILLFRNIKGALQKISDLSLMPGWGGKKYKIFIEQNFIKDELVC